MNYKRATPPRERTVQMTTTEKAPKTAKAPKPLVQCACGCGEKVARTFKQGHDQRLVSNLASDLVYENVWDGRCAGILTADEVKSDIQGRIDKVTAYVRSKLSDPLANKVYNAAMRSWELEKTQGQREEGKAKRKAEAEAKKAAAATKRAAAKKAKADEAVQKGSHVAGSPQPSGRPVGKVVTATATNEDVDAEEAAADAEAVPGFKPGDTVKVKVGKRTRTATVHGMNQAGKVTAVKLLTNGTETIKTEGQFQVVATTR